MERAAARATTSFLVFGAVAAGVYGTSLVLAGTLRDLDSAGAVAAGMTLDMILVVPLAFYLAVIRRHRLPLVTLVPVLVLGFLAASLILPDDHKQALEALEWLALPLELALVGWIGWRASRALRRAGRDARADVPERLHAAAVDLLGSDRAAALLATEISVLHYALRGWRATPHVPAGTAGFSHHRLGAHGPLVLALMPVLAGETFAVHFLVAIFSPALAWILTIASIYTCIWLLADWRATVLRPVLVDARRISFRAGLRWSVSVPRPAVVRISGQRPAPGKACLSLNLLGSPTHWIILDRPVEARGPYGLRRRVRAIGIQPDDPGEFERALAGRPDGCPDTGSPERRASR